MPARRIPKNHLTVTGAFASKKNGRMMGFESLLEREHMLLLEFDPRVVHFEEQPVTVPVRDESSRSRKYVPDVLVHYETDTQMRPALMEVKHTRDLARNEEKYAAKFGAALQFAQAHGWDFSTVTEQSIRGPFLQNLKFLREYRNVHPGQEAITHVLATLEEAGGVAKVGQLLARLGHTEDELLAWVPVVWHLVVSGQIGADLGQPLTDQTLLMYPSELAP